MQQSQEYLDRRGFSRAVGPQQSKDFAASYFKVDAINGSGLGSTPEILEDFRQTTNDNRVFTFKSASTLNGQVAPDAILTVTGASLRQIAVDRAGTGYLTNQAAAASVLVFDNIATLNGTFNADRTIAGNQTQITSPFGIYLWE